MIATGICHTDLASAHGHKGPGLPAILGHEGSGIVEKVGADVRHVEVSDHVLLTYNACLECKPCQRGSPSYCKNGERVCFGGARLDGTKTFSLDGKDINSAYFGQSSFSKRSIVRGFCAVKIDKSLPLEILCIIGCGIQTGAGTVLNVLKPQVGSSIAIFGVGGVGLAAIMAAKNFTPASKIIAVDIVDLRLDIAKELGATHTVNSKGGDIVALLNSLTDGDGVDRTVDCTGNLTVIQNMIAATANNGIAATVGGAPHGRFVQIEPATWIGRNVSYVGSCQGSSVPKTFIPALVEFWKQGRFPIDKISKSYSYKDVNKAVEDMESGHTIKPVLIWED
ncbi:uncharacterized protein N7483_009681 [Penicillium malachiteum]|uniref:uncharacterized protein n=1 Tax=Penicillium malachiteum TaxID=1324776 RepID=UPI002546FB16|nr:uncharacterized protein N7483_009681 [Penicillium malachiteum]KAJ5721747.1 hypothetical protein N7483_009681 [Penicillium malachiteum]